MSEQEQHPKQTRRTSEDSFHSFGDDGSLGEGGGEDEDYIHDDNFLEDLTPPPTPTAATQQQNSNNTSAKQQHRFDAEKIVSNHFFADSVDADSFKTQTP